MPEETKTPDEMNPQNAEDEQPTSSNPLEFKDMETFVKEGFKINVLATKHANALPKDRDFSFYKAIGGFNKTINYEGDRILGLINRILRENNVEGNIKNRPFEERVELVIEANDCILEDVANSIDEIEGLRKLPEMPVVQMVSADLPVNGSWNRMDKFSKNKEAANGGNKSSKSVSLLSGKNIIRPQKFFKDLIDNSNSYPWMPRIKEKPNSLKPLALYLIDTEFGETYCHPYEVELDKFSAPDDLLKDCIPYEPKNIEDTKLIEVTTEEQLNDLLEDLRKYNEIAIDLEHHSYRTFLGITCLMQISTVDTDYLIDTLALRDKVHILNEVFTKPSVVKIFHGADSDILWLQRDLSLYIVNMFDTHKAAKQLGFSGLSLSYLLNRYCAFLPNKQFQLADWRIRPLPAELKSYAREDTHYLIYIYHKLRNELLKKSNGQDNLLRSVIQASTEVCKKQYFKPILNDSSHLDFYRKCKRSFDNRQMYALKELYNWRDSMAREEDESTSYVLPNHMMLQIAEMLPREIQGVLACCNPIPPLVKANALEIHQIMLRAREQPLEKPIMKDDSRTCSAKESIKLNIDSPLHCPHDLTKLQEFRDDLPTLLGSNNESKTSAINKRIPIEQSKSVFSAFNTAQKVLKSKKVQLPKFLGPYERYKLIKPFIQEEEKKAQELKEKNAAAAAAAKEDDPSVEDRIASLHKHFVKVQESVKKPEVDQNRAPSETLLALGGVKKRKRDPSAEISTEDANATPDHIQFLTTVPSPAKPNLKRKRNDSVEAEQQQHHHSGSNKKYKGNDRFGKDKRNSFGKNGRGRGNNKRGGESPGRHAGKKNKGEDGGGFKAYDYSGVDFNQYQGGAGGTMRGKNNRGKNKNRGGGGGRGRSNSKSFSFGGGNKRGRGR